MKYIKYLFLAVLGLILITVALANAAPVELKLLPRAMTELLGFQERIVLPLYLVILGSIVVGILIGFLWEWLREWKIRRAAESRGRELNRLERENRKLRAETGETDDVLAALDAPTREPEVVVVEKPNPVPATSSAVATR